MLECAAARDAFLARTHSITWQDALDRSRQQGQSEEELKAHKLKLLSQQLVRLVVGQMAKQGGADLERKELGVFRTGSECFKLVLKKRVTFGRKLKSPKQPPAGPVKKPLTDTPPVPSTTVNSVSRGDFELDKAIQTLVKELRGLDPQFLTLKEGAANELIDQWLKRGWALGKLREDLAARNPQGEMAHTWPRNIDYLLGDHTRRLSERDRLRHEVGELVRQLNQQANDPGIYRKLVALGCDYYIHLKLFKQCLRQAKLETSRISEVTRIIACEATAQQFIAGEISVRRALFLARSIPRPRGPSSTNGEAKQAAKAAKAEKRWAQRLAAIVQTLLQLVRTATKQTPESWQIQLGLYQLSFEQIPLTEEDGAVICVLQRRNFLWRLIPTQGSLRQPQPRARAAPA